MQFVVLMAAVLAQTGSAPAVGGATVDGVQLSSSELDQYNAMAQNHAAMLSNTKAFIERVVSWIDDTAPLVIKNQTERDHVAQMRSDFIMLGKRTIEALAAQRVTGVEVRTHSLQQAKDAAQQELTRAKDSLAKLEADPTHSQEGVDQLKALTAAKQAAYDDAAAALTAWTTAHPAS